MLTLYASAKFLHIAAVIVWIGGVAALSFINLRLTRTHDLPLLAALSREGSFYGRAVVAPAAALTLLAGIVTAARMGVGFSTLWITWGFVAIFLSLALGASFIRITYGKLRELTRVPNLDATRVLALQRRLGVLNGLNLLLLLSAVWAMVFKPTL